MKLDEESLKHFTDVAMNQAMLLVEVMQRGELDELTVFKQIYGSQVRSSATSGNDDRSLFLLLAMANSATLMLLANALYEKQQGQ